MRKAYSSAWSIPLSPQGEAVGKDLVFEKAVSPLPNPGSAQFGEEPRQPHLSLQDQSRREQRQGKVLCPYPRLRTPVGGVGG